MLKNLVSCNLSLFCYAKNAGHQEVLKIIFLVAVLLPVLSACTDKYILPDLPNPSEAPQYYQPLIEDDYRIQIADKLAIQSYYDQQLNQARTVRPDGRISLVLIGEVVAVNKTPADLSAEIKKAYAQYLSDPDINVVMSEILPRRMYVGGEVKAPSVHIIEGPLTLMQVITLSGGFKDTANFNQVLLLRNRGDDLETHQIDTDKILTNEIPDIFMSQSDVVFVPRTNIANLGLFVDQYLSKMVPDFIRVNFGFNYQFGTIKTEQDTILTTPIITP